MATAQVILAAPKGAGRLANKERPPDTSSFRGRLGANVRKRRKALGLTQEALIVRLANHGVEITASALSLYETGIRPIGTDQLPAFAAALETTPRKLIPE